MQDGPFDDKSGCPVSSPPPRFTQPSLALDGEKSCVTNSKRPKIATDVPDGFNTTKIKGNGELSFLPGENLVI